MKYYFSSPIKKIFVGFLLFAFQNINAQNVGVGTASPLTTLHVYGGASGAFPFVFSPLAVESSGHTYINILCPAAYESAILFGLPGSSANGGIIYNNVNTLNGFQFRNNGNITRMVINSAGNMGINNSLPSEKLDVTGNVRADNFKFTTPKTYHYSISGADFNPQATTDTLTIGIGSGGASMQTNVNGKRIIAPVHLPEGAAMIKMTAYIYDGSVPQNLQVFFYRKTILSNFFPDNIGFLASTGSSSNTIAYEAAIPTAGASNIVDNALYTYYIAVDPQNIPASWGIIMELRAIVIEYTLNAAQ